MDIEYLIQKYATENGFIAGFCEIKPTPLLENVKSAIVIGVGNGKKLNFELDDVPRGVLAAYCVGMDYHITVRRELTKLKNYLHKQDVKFDSYIHVDAGPLPERFLALNAKIGWLGKNQCVFSEKFGSFFNIGCMLVSIPLQWRGGVRPNLADDGVVSLCRGCDLCLSSCPTNAITDNGYDYKKCISYITQKRGDLTKWEQTVIGQHLFGCDLCQLSCPLNSNKHVDEIIDINEAMPALDLFTSMTKSTFKAKYGHTSIYWRGVSTIKRNAKIIMNNFYKKGDN